MYGTIARLRVKAGHEEALREHLKQYKPELASGFVAAALYAADEGRGTHWLAVVFESKEQYQANAGSPEQDVRYQEFRGLLDADPEWHDGEVTLRATASD